MPYSNRLKVIVPFKDDLKFLYNKIEFNWFNVASGELTEEEINKMLFDFKDEFANIENKNLKEEILLDNETFKEKADEKTELYFKNNF